MTSECWDEPAEIALQTLWDVLSPITVTLPGGATRFQRC
jgi:hypothetical protein